MCEHFLGLSGVDKEIRRPKCSLDLQLKVLNFNLFIAVLEVMGSTPESLGVLRNQIYS